jgi:hypothetical protein
MRPTGTFSSNGRSCSPRSSPVIVSRGSIERRAWRCLRPAHSHRPNSFSNWSVISAAPSAADGTMRHQRHTGSERLWVAPDPQVRSITHGCEETLTCAEEAAKGCRRVQGATRRTAPRGAETAPSRPLLMASRPRLLGAFVPAGSLAGSEGRGSCTGEPGGPPRSIFGTGTELAEGRVGARSRRARPSSTNATSPRRPSSTRSSARPSSPSSLAAARRMPLLLGSSSASCALTCTAEFSPAARPFLLTPPCLTIPILGRWARTLLL